MGTETEKALQELREFLKAEDIYDGDEIADGITAFIKEHSKQGDELAVALDDAGELQVAIEKTEQEMAEFIGQHDAARSLWNLLLNLHAEFSLPASMGPSVTTLDFEGCERVVQELAKTVRGAIKAGHGRLR